MTAPDRLWPVGGYAPGNYWCVCTKCQKQHMADKRAWMCADCVIQQLRDPAVLAALPEVQTIVAAKLEEVLRLQPYDDDGFKAVHNDPEVFVRLDDIRALITPDMTTALKARDKRIRQEERERAVAECRNHYERELAVSDADLSSEIKSNRAAALGYLLACMKNL